MRLRSLCISLLAERHASLVKTSPLLHIKFILIRLEIGSEVVIKLQISRTIVVIAKAVKIAKDRSNSNVELEICKAANELAMLILCETSKSDAIFFKEG